MLDYIIIERNIVGNDVVLKIYTFEGDEILEITRSLKSLMKKVGEPVDKPDIRIVHPVDVVDTMVKWGFDEVAIKMAWQKVMTAALSPGEYIIIDNKLIINLGYESMYTIYGHVIEIDLSWLKPKVREKLMTVLEKCGGQQLVKAIKEMETGIELTDCVYCGCIKIEEYLNGDLLYSRCCIDDDFLMEKIVNYRRVLWETLIECIEPQPKIILRL